MTELVQALEEHAERQGEAKSVLELLDRMKPEIAKVLPDHVTPERMTRLVVTELRRTPKLLDCSPPSLLGAFMLASQLGLEPGPLGHVYLVPYKGEVTLIVGYKGMIDLAYRSGQVKSVTTGTVREGDDFDFRDGTRPFLDHRQSGPSEGREPVAYYAAASLKSGGSPFRVLWPDDIERTKARAASSSSPLSPWATDFDAMARKTCVRRLFPLLPSSPVLARALSADGEVAPPLEDEIEAAGE